MNKNKHKFTIEVDNAVEDRHFAIREEVYAESKKLGRELTSRERIVIEQKYPPVKW